jgi:SPP1 family predicted phage head-tail adaptor
MDIAAMSIRITFQKNEVRSDKYANHKSTWSDYFTCWATAGPFSGKESGGTVINPEETLNFTVRWCKVLEDIEPTKYRIICKGKVYNINYVNPMGFKNNSLKFTCSLERRNDGKNSKD